MNEPKTPPAGLNWDDLRLFQMLARLGTVRAAGQALGLSHSTLSRRLDGLEAAVGTALLRRGPRGVTLTEAGVILLADVDRAGRSVDAGLRRVSGLDQRIAGPVRLTLPDFMAYGGILGALAAFQARHPQVTLEVDISYAASDLDRREADIALRLTGLGDSPPATLVGRKLAVSHATGYASPAYLAAQDLANPGGGAAWLGWAPADPPDWVRHSSHPHLPVRGSWNHAGLQQHAARAGLGLAYLPCIIGDGDPGLVRLPGAVPRPARDVWLLTHVDLRDAARMKALRDHLAGALRGLRPRLEGQRSAGLAAGKRADI